ncbi:MAG: T9SS type A sorting domain-containing protein [Candidatus Kapaibacterium sp.]
MYGNIIDKISTRWVKDGPVLYGSGKSKKDNRSSLFASSDNGFTWQLFSTSSRTDEILNIYASHDTLVRVFSDDGIDNKSRESDIEYSVVGRIAWQHISPPVSSLANAILFSNFHNGNLYLTPPEDNSFYETNDFGATWMTKEYPEHQDYRYFENPVFYGNRMILPELYQIDYDKFHLFISTDDGNSFTLDSNFIRDSISLFPSASENGVLYASAAMSGQEAVFYSPDSGSNWYLIPGDLPDVSNLFIGTDYLFMSGNDGLWRFPKSAVPLSVAKSKSISSISLGDCYPTPASSEMHITYSIPKRSTIALTVFDITGKEIAAIASEDRDAGSYETLWDAKAFPSGSYILKLTACGESVTKVVEVIR